MRSATLGCKVTPENSKEFLRKCVNLGLTRSCVLRSLVHGFIDGAFHVEVNGPSSTSCSAKAEALSDSKHNRTRRDSQT